MLNFYVRQGMIFGKVHEIVSFERSKCLEKNNSLTTQYQKEAKNDFE